MTIAGDIAHPRRGSGRAAALRAQLRLGRLPLPVGLYLFALIVPLWFSVGPLALSTLRLLLLALIVPLTLRLLAGRYGRLLPTDILFLLHILWATAALAVNNPDRVVQSAGSSGIEFIGGYVLARAYIRDRASFVALCRWIAVLAVATLPLALVQSLTAQAPLLRLLEALPLFDTVREHHPDPRMGLYRAQVTFAHPIHYGLFCAIAFSLCFVGLKQVWATPLRVVAGAAIALACFLSISSGGVLALALQFGLILWAWALAGVRLRWHILGGVAVLAYVAIDMLSNRAPLAVFMHYATFSAHNAWMRMAIFEAGLANVMASPMFGIGLHDYARPAWLHTDSVDNFWLLMAMRYGFPGLAFLAAGYLWGVVAMARRDLSQDPETAQLRLAWMLTFVGMSFTLATVHVWHSVYSFVFFIFGAGLWIVAGQAEAPAAVRAAPPGPRAPATGTRSPSGAAPELPSAPRSDGPSTPQAGAMRAAGPATVRAADAATSPDRPGLRFTRFPPGTPAPDARRHRPTAPRSARGPDA